MLIYDILDRVRERPALFVGKKRLTLLKSFLEGATFSAYMLGIDSGYDDFSPIPFRFFNDYVAKYYNYEATSGWGDMILSKTNGENETGVDAFYTLLDSFRSIAIAKIQKCILTQEQIYYHMENEHAPKRLSLNDYNQTKPLFADPEAIYLIELSDDSGYLCLVESHNTSFLYSCLLRSRRCAIKYFKRNFSGSYHWHSAESIPEKFEWV